MFVLFYVELVFHQIFFYIQILLNALIGHWGVLKLRFKFENNKKSKSVYD